MEKLPEVWTTRNYPVLREVGRQIDAGIATPTRESVMQATGLSEEEVIRAGEALKRRGLVDTIDLFGAPALRFKDVSGEAYLVTGLHPDGDDAISKLVDALRQAADQQSDPSEKSKLRALADGIGGVSRDVMAGVLTAVLSGAAGF